MFMTGLKRTILSDKFKCMMLSALFNCFHISKHFKNVEVIETLVNDLNVNGFITRGTFSFMTPKIYRIHVSTSDNFKRIGHGRYVIVDDSELYDFIIAFKEFNLFYDNCVCKCVVGLND